MLNSGILDVVIGLVLVYIVLAMMCTAINELLEGWLKVRAVELERGIRELLNDPNGKGLAKKLYEHPLVYALFSGTYDPDKIGKNKKYESSSKLPSYIPARNFALALMDLAVPGSAAQPSGAKGATAPLSQAAQISAAAPTSGTTSNSPAQSASTAGGGQTQALKSGLPALSNPHVERALRTLIDAAGEDLSQARANIEQWFDSTMDRVSGRYKRHAQTVTLIVAAAVVILLNADTIMISKALTEDTALRQSLVAAAQEYAKANALPTPKKPEPAPAQPPGGNVKPEADKKDVKAADKQESKTTVNTAGDKTAKEGASKVKIPEACRKDAASAECKVEQNALEIRSLGLPLGWSRDDRSPEEKKDQTASYKKERTAFPGEPGEWLLKILGLLTTIIAVSLGAPFWFDALNKVMVVRATVKPKEKSPDEPAVDRPRGTR
jgi:hypothetical protein